MLVTFSLPILVLFPSIPWFIRQYTCLLIQNISSFFRSRLSPFSALERARGARVRGGGMGHTGGKKLFADSRAELFWHAIYCANLMPDASSQSGSWSLRGMMIWAPRIMCEYDLETAIAIRPLIQILTCEIGSSIFAAMSRIKISIMTRDSSLEYHQQR